MSGWVGTYQVSERAHTAETGVMPDPPGHRRKVHCSGVSSFNGGVTWSGWQRVREVDVMRVGVRTLLGGELLQWRGHLEWVIGVFIWVRDVDGIRVGCQDIAQG